MTEKKHETIRSIRVDADQPRTCHNIFMLHRADKAASFSREDLIAIKHPRPHRQY
jgi:hypothetical protein